MCGVGEYEHGELGSQRQPPASAAEPPPSIPQPNIDNCFRILVATDNHIGYAEKDPVRGQDAINTFREILEIARDEDVDFILLAGDLSHENRPSRSCLHQTIALLREYTLGDKPISFELMSDPMDGATPGFSFPAVNYEDPNLNVGIPVFSIHGNHDDPQGTGPEGALCALDVLSVSGVLNYFGKVDLVSDEHNETEDKGIKIRPVLLRKGSTHLALYGVGNVKDARMHYELRSNRVQMFMPADGDIPADDWFNMLLIHQNRIKHGPQQSVPEGMFDDSIKLVVWGHEHDCRIWPEPVEGKPYYISQPGSSVATSLAPGEALPKHVGILSVQGDKFQMAEIPLKTVRPFELDEIFLTEEAAAEGSKIVLDDKDTITAFLREKVEELILKARIKWEETHDKETEEMMLPLIRLKVETSGAKEMTNPVRFGQDFVGRVANPRDILQYYRKKVATRKITNNPDLPDADDPMEGDDDEEDPAAITTSDRLAKIRMANLVRQYLQAQNLEVLVEGGLEDAVMRFVDKDDKDAIKDFVSDSLKHVGKDLRAQPVNDEDVEERLIRAKEAAAAHWAEHPRTEKDTGNGRAGKSKRRGKGSDADSMAEDSMAEESDEQPPARTTKASTAAKGRATRTTKAKGKPALFDHGSDASDGQDIVSDDDDEDDYGRSAPARKAPSRATTSKGTTSRGTAASRKAAASTTTTRATRGRAASSKAARGTPRQTQLSFSKGRGSKLVDSDSD